MSTKAKTGTDQLIDSAGGVRSEPEASAAPCRRRAARDPGRGSRSSF